jgi:hypothetical protein
MSLPSVFTFADAVWQDLLVPRQSVGLFPDTGNPCLSFPLPLGRTRPLKLYALLALPQKGDTVWRMGPTKNDVTDALAPRALLRLPKDREAAYRKDPLSNQAFLKERDLWALCFTAPPEWLSAVLIRWSDAKTDTSAETAYLMNLTFERG